MTSVASPYVKRLSHLKSLRSPFESHWAECYRYGCPERLQSFVGAETGSAQTKARAELLDATAAEAVQLLVASNMSGTTPANTIWFQPQLDGQDEDETSLSDGERWLEQAAKFVWRNIHAANFDSEALEANTDVVVAGWMALYIDTDRKVGGFVFDAWPISTCWIASSRADGRVDTIYREHELNAQAVVNQYPNTASERVRSLAEKSPDVPVKVLHVIEPREGKSGMLARNMPFKSCHVEIEGGNLLEESGYHEFPVAVARWRRVPGSVYARGQMSLALPDAKTINKLMEITLQSAELSVSKMWIAKDDGVVNPHTIKIKPGLVIPANEIDSIQSLTDDSNFQVAEYLLNSLQSSIRKKLMADQLQPAHGPAMTATEVHVRVDLIRQQLGPIYGRQQSEYLHPLLDRCFGLALRAGVLGQPPEELQGKNLTYKYISPLARAQRLDEVAAIERLAAGIGQLADVEQSVLDNIDFDAAAQITGQGLGVPVSVLRDKEAIAKLRQDRADALQAQQEQQQMMALQQKAGETAIDTVAKGAA